MLADGADLEGAQAVTSARVSGALWDDIDRWNARERPRLPDMHARPAARRPRGAAARVAWDGRTFIVAETVLADEPRGDQLVAAVAAAMLDQLARQHYALVEFEGHDSDPHIDIIKSIPALRHDPLTILITPT